jgi:saxitoxin biosynthesis operon SxtJ-like protein
MSMLKAIWRKWLVVAHAIGRVNSHIIMMIVYYVFMTPFAMAVRWFADPLRLRAEPGWQPLPVSTVSPPPTAMDVARRQF